MLGLDLSSPHGGKKNQHLAEIKSLQYVILRGVLFHLSTSAVMAFPQFCSAFRRPLSSSTPSPPRTTPSRKHFSSLLI